MSVTELNKTIPMVTPKGTGRAFVLIDYGEEHNLIWVVAQDSGEIWAWQNSKVKLQSNITMGRVPNDKPDIAAAQALAIDLFIPAASRAEFIRAQNDAQLYGAGFIQYLLGENGDVQARRLNHADVTVRTTDPKEDKHD